MNVQYFLSEDMMWIRKRNVSLRRFLRIHISFDQKTENHQLTVLFTG